MKWTVPWRTGRAKRNARPVGMGESESTSTGHSDAPRVGEGTGQAIGTAGAGQPMALRPEFIVDHVLRILDGIESAAPELAPQVGELRGVMAAPPRFLVTGRMKAGKSTLVNALVRNRIAATAVLECTDAVTVYVDGLSEHIGPLDWPLGAPGESTASVRMHVMPSAALKNMSFVDAPGLGSLDFRNRELAHGAARMRKGLGFDGWESIDAAVYVFDSVLRADELDFVRGLGFGSLGTVGVLSRADDFAEGAFGDADPMAAAEAHAADLAEHWQGWFSGVLPVSALMSQTAETGGVTEDIAARLATLGGLPRREAIRELEREDPQLLGPEVRRDLLADFGAYGVLEGREIAAGGGVALRDWLRVASGMERLRSHLLGDAAYAAALARAGKVIAAARQLAFDAHDARAVTAAIDGAADPAAKWRIDLYPLLARLESDGMANDVAGLVSGALTADSAASLARQPYGGPAAEIAGALDVLLLEARTRLTGFPAPAEEAALTILSGVYARAAAEMRGEIADSGLFPN